MFQNYIWNFFKLLRTVLMEASMNNRTEIVKILVEQKGIDVNSTDI